MLLHIVEVSEHASKSPAGAYPPLYNFALGDTLSDVRELERLEDFP
jgi:hypothetical protein